MFYEIRTYRLRNGAIPTYLKVVEEEGIAIQRKHLGELVGYFFSKSGRSTRSSISGLIRASMSASVGEPHS